MSKSFIFTVVGLVIVAVAFFFLFRTKTHHEVKTPNPTPTDSSGLEIASLQKKSYPGSDITIEQTLVDGENYHQYIVSYLSDGLKIFGLLTIPTGNKPKNGWPVILFNHGYITPSSYQTYPIVGQYASYFPVFSRNGYIVFKPDYRGNGNSQGTPDGTYYSSSYVTDDLNALSSIKKFKDANPNKIGIWGHSMGGNITLKDLVIDPHDIKAAVIWSGVVGTYSDIFNWHDPSYHPSTYELSLRNKNRALLVQKYGTPATNPAFWNAIDPVQFVSSITAPIQLHVGEADEEVPASFSEHLYEKLKAAGISVELYTYPGADHNISQAFDLAMQRTLVFFNTYLKQ